MKTTIPLRIKTARQIAGLSRKKLSDELDIPVSPTLIKKYEEGKVIPPPNILLAIAEVLKVKIEFFSRPVRFRLGQVEFRKKTSLGKKEIETIKGKTIDLLERSIAVEDLSGLTRNFSNPIASKEIRTIEDIESAVQELKTQWDLKDQPVIHILQLLEKHQIKVLEIKSSPKFDGLSALVEGIPVVLLNKDFPTERKRFTALHELGHLVLALASVDENKKESFCNYFAGAFLISAHRLYGLLGKRRAGVPELKDLIKIKESYGISIQAIVRRAYELDIINKTAYQQFNRQIAHNRAEIGLGNFPLEEKVTRNLELIFQLYQAKKLNLERASSLAQMTTSNFFASAMANKSVELEDGRASIRSASNFNNAFGLDEPEYHFTDLMEINPDYDPR